MDLQLKMDKDFEKTMAYLEFQYGEDFEKLNGFHESQMNFSDFINAFVDKNVAEVTIDPNANVGSKDIRSLLSEKGKSHDKLFAFNKIFHDMKKRYGLSTARKWLETEYNGGFYMHDASTTTYMPYCFSGETRIMTKAGIKRLDEIVGQDVMVLNKNHGWENAIIRSFGVQPLRKITLERRENTKEIYATGNHQWYIREGNKPLKIVKTDDLKEGMRIPFNATKTWSNVLPSPFGVAHGFFIGDGDKGKKMRANFCGDKESLIPYFTPAKIGGAEKEKTIQGVPKYFSSLPSLDESAGYLYGWLSGYFAADGNVDERGRCTLSSAKRENLEFAQDVLCVLGMPVNEIKYQDRVSNLTGEMGRIYHITLSKNYLREDFFIRPIHKERWKATCDNETRERHWIVKSVEKTDRIEEVFCAVVDGTQSFTLDGNVLTHNCYAYDLTRLAKEGLFFLKNYNAKPAKHLTTFLDDVIEYISYMSNRSSGAVGIPNVLIWTYYFWKKDCETGYAIKDPDYYIRQSFQKLIYRLNQPFMRISYD